MKRLAIQSTDCDHSPNYSRGLCRKCYNDWYYANRKEMWDKHKYQRISNSDAAAVFDLTKLTRNKRGQCVNHPEVKATARSLCRKCYQRLYAAQRREKVRAYARAWDDVNREKVRESAKKYAASHPEETLARSQRRRARLMGALGSHTAAEWRALKDHWDHKCAYCGVQPKVLSKDHRIPLIRSGTDYIANILPACRICNSKKGRLTEQEFRLATERRTILKTV